MVYGSLERTLVLNLDNLERFSLKNIVIYDTAYAMFFFYLLFFFSIMRSGFMHKKTLKGFGWNTGWERFSISCERKNFVLAKFLFIISSLPLFRIATLIINHPRSNSRKIHPLPFFHCLNFSQPPIHEEIHFSDCWQLFFGKVITLWFEKKGKREGRAKGRERKRERELQTSCQADQSTTTSRSGRVKRVINFYADQIGRLGGFVPRL